nr:hypothetical protein [Tanacetum cinerariifolium]
AASTSKISSSVDGAVVGIAEAGLGAGDGVTGLGDHGRDGGGKYTDINFLTGFTMARTAANEEIIPRASDRKNVISRCVSCVQDPLRLEPQVVLEPFEGTLNKKNTTQDQQEGLTNFALMDYTSQVNQVQTLSQMNKSDLNDVHVNESQVIGNSLIDSHESDGEDNQVNDRFKKNDSVFKFAISENVTSVNETETSTSKTRVVIYGYDGLLMHQVDPPSPDYVLGPEEPEQAPLLPDYVPGPEYLEYLALSDKEVPVEDQPYVVSDSPIALSPGYIADSDLEEDLENESEDGPTDYPTDGGDDDDDSLGDDVNNEDEEKASGKDEEEEEEHLALADSTAATSPVLDLFPSVEETGPFETDESATTPPPPSAYRTTARMSIRAQTHIPFLFEAEVDRLLAIPTPPPSTLTPLSSPLPQIPSPPFHVPSPPTTSLTKDVSFYTLFWGRLTS